MRILDGSTSTLYQAPARSTAKVRQSVLMQGRKTGAVTFLENSPVRLLPNRHERLFFRQTLWLGTFPEGAETARSRLKLNFSPAAPRRPGRHGSVTANPSPPCAPSRRPPSTEGWATQRVAQRSNTMKAMSFASAAQVHRFQTIRATLSCALCTSPLASSEQ